MFEFNFPEFLGRSRSKSAVRRQTLDNSSSLPSSSSHYRGFSENGIPIYHQQPTSQPRPRSRSGGLYHLDDKGSYHYANPYPPEMSYTSLSPSQQQLYYVPTSGHYFHHGQVVYPGSRKGHLDDSPLSSHLETQPRGRPRSNTAHAAHEKLQISTAAGGAYHVPLVEGYASAPSSHEGSKNGIFGFIQSIRSRSKSKSRERDALFSARSTGSTHSINTYSHRAVDSRGRPLYEKDLQKGEYRDVEAELARQMERMEKDLRLQDMDDPYRPVRRDRSRSFGSVDSHASESRRHRDLDPDVRDNTKYNAVSLKYNALESSRPSQMARMHSDMSHHSGYATDVQPSMHRRSTTGTVHSSVHSSRSSRTNPASHGSAPAGWFNRRGDQFINRSTVIRQPKEHEYSQRFAHYPEVGKGFADSIGNVIGPNGQLIKRVG